MNRREVKYTRWRESSNHDQVGRGCSKIITIFQWVLIFEQSVNYRHGPRWWPQIGAAGVAVAERRGNKPELADQMRSARRETTRWQNEVAVNFDYGLTIRAALGAPSFFAIDIAVTGVNRRQEVWPRRPAAGDGKHNG